jgi:hypothetical protein
LQFFPRQTRSTRISGSHWKKLPDLLSNGISGSVSKQSTSRSKDSAPHLLQLHVRIHRKKNGAFFVLPFVRYTALFYRTSRRLSALRKEHPHAGRKRMLASPVVLRQTVCSALYRLNKNRIL